MSEITNTLPDISIVDSMLIHKTLKTLDLLPTMYNIVTMVNCLEMARKGSAIDFVMASCAVKGIACSHNDADSAITDYRINGRLKGTVTLKEKTGAALKICKTVMDDYKVNYLEERT